MQNTSQKKQDRTTKTLTPDKGAPRDLQPAAKQATGVKGGATTVKGSKSNSDN